jgi:hypothetical protein
MSPQIKPFDGFRHGLKAYCSLIATTLTVDCNQPCQHKSRRQPRMLWLQFLTSWYMRGLNVALVVAYCSTSDSNWEFQIIQKRP